MDDSGTRHPDHLSNLPKHNHDWFSLGGILIDDDQIPLAKQMIDEFRRKWPQMGDSPLHSWEIRGCHANFKWLERGSDTCKTFLGDLENLLFALPVIGLACVIDRPGYNKRYREKYGRERWALCKTSFAVAVERATKYALARQRKLRVYVEKTNKQEDATLQGYYNALKSEGHWFNPAMAEKYTPVTPDQYKNTLYEFKTKNKTSPLMQIADIYLWPICMGGYERKNFAYSRLKDAGKLMDCILTEEDLYSKGIKYSCFDD